MLNFKYNKKKRQLEGSAQMSYNGSTLIAVAGLDGYDWKHYTRHNRWSSTKHKNVHIAMNGPLQLTWAELKELAQDLLSLAEDGPSELRELEKNENNKDL